MGAQPLPQALRASASKSRRSHSLSLGRQAQLPRALARAVWRALPGVPRWAGFDDVGASATVGARLHRPPGGSAVEPCPRGLDQAQGGTRGTLACTVLFVARAPNASVKLNLTLTLTLALTLTLTLTVTLTVTLTPTR